VRNRILNKKSAAIVMEDIPLLPETAELAELIGIVLGDGSFYITDNHYQLDIAFDAKEENYLDFVESLLKNIADVEVCKKRDKHAECLHIRVSRKNDVLTLLHNTIKFHGDKIKNNVSIPEWIFGKEEYMKSCLRGLIDTDGSIFRMSKRDSNLFRISFKNVNTRLLNDCRRTMLKLGFHPSKVIDGKGIFLSRQSEIKRYAEEIGFNNPKNLNRYTEIAPSSSGQEVAPLS